MRQRPCKCGFCGARHLVGVLVVWCIRVVSIVNDKSPFIEEKGLCKPHLSSFLQVNAFLGTLRRCGPRAITHMFRRAMSKLLGGSTKVKLQV